ncbi:NADPH:quinone reductase-like Zn-dependent oxidoreductase [Granulicella aggregans]|uniref:NADPH:quinone reductase-like Zn-dependent oxidoreductase n=2 Tax=Granulicella aggregans TaxID=474949 RepID=A0A7W7ZGV1_9BACT|nr:zinc-binding dehydrogenase [Granulicella aggregans]MBB5059369.1 NADPH:quinone reductase-like Zn-dependent oxidoreductase [Granulicella aggregans]
MDVSFSVGSVMEKRIRLQGNNTGPVADLTDAAKAMTNHKIKPILDTTFAMDQAQAAYAHVAEGGHFGKVAIRIP